MRSREELEVLWSDLPRLSREAGTIRHITVRKARGVHEVVETVELSPDGGVHGDRWSRDPAPKLGEQVTLMNLFVARLVRVDSEQPLHTAGDNFLVDIDLSENALPVGAQLRLGDALLQVSDMPHLGCKKFRERFGADALAWVNHADNRAQRLRGVNCQIIAAGMVSVGDAIVVLPRE